MSRKYFNFFVFVFISLLILIFLSSCKSSNNINYLCKDTLYLKTTDNNFNNIDKKYYNENVVSFENNNSTKSLYIFSSPAYIKINDNSYDLCNNKIQKISNDEKYLYTNTTNDIKAYLPKKLSQNNDICLKYENFKMNIFLNTKGSDNSSVSEYNNIYNKYYEHICYSDALNDSDLYIGLDDFGINTEFVINNNPGNIEYNVKVENVILDSSCADYILFKDAKSKDIKAIIYKPVILKNSENLIDGISDSTCTMEIKPIENNLYKVIINLDNINNSDYPIKINQSFHLYKTKQPDSAIYSKSNMGYYLNDKVILGTDAQKGEGQLLVRFETLAQLDLSPDDIISAEYIISEISGNNQPATITMYPIMSSWCSIGVRWSTKPSFTKDYNNSVVVTKSGNYIFNITEPVKMWLKNIKCDSGYTIRDGFILVNETSTTPKIFATGDNGMFTTCLKINLKSKVK